MRKKYFVLVAIFGITCFLNVAIAQPKDSSKTVDLFADLDNESKSIDANSTDFANATFKATKIINGHSVEMVGKHNLDYRISHRFGFFSSGAYELFGLDNATIRNGLDYGVCDKLTIGLGRSSVDKEFDGYIKYKLLRQSTGKIKIPVSIVYVMSAMNYTLKSTKDISFTNRMSYAHQVLIARKFSDNVSLQLTPTLVHINLVNLSKEDNNLYSLGFGGRVKISKRLAINAEYFYQFNKLEGTTNSFSLGLDIETGGHVFQLHFTNSTGMTERSFITNTVGDWGKNDIRFGFNIGRTFVTKKMKGSRSSY